jgi:antitoxin MazE
MEIAMKVSKWGNSLAIRLPSDLVEKLGVKEGDELVDASPAACDRKVILERKKTLEEMWARVDEIRKTLNVPQDYKFNRDEIYESRGKFYKDE